MRLENSRPEAMEPDFGKKLVEIGIFLDKIGHCMSEISQKPECSEKIDLEAEWRSRNNVELVEEVKKLLIFLVEVSEVLKKMNKEEIESISTGLRDRKRILRLFEYSAFFIFRVCSPNGVGMSLDLWKHSVVFKILKDQRIKTSFVENEELYKRNREILIMAANVFEIVMKNEVFVNFFNIGEKSILYTLSIYGELGFFAKNKDKDWSEKFYYLLESLPFNILLSTLIRLNNPRCPKWMKEVVCKELVKITRKPGGITAIVEFVKVTLYENEITINDFDKVVSLVTLIPKDIEKEEYIKSISPELLSMLDHPFEKSYLYQTSGRIISVLLLNYPELTQNHIISKIIELLHTPKQNQSDESVENSIKRIEKICLQSDSNIIINVISPIFIVLWAASCFSHKTHKYIWRDRIIAILLSYIFLSCQLTSIWKIIENFLSTGDTYFSFSNGEHGGISIEINNSDIILSVEDVDSRIENFGFLIDKFRNDQKLMEDIFLKLLNYCLNRNRNSKEDQDPLKELYYLKILILMQNNYITEITKNTEKIFQILMEIISNFNNNYKLSQTTQDFKDIDQPSLNNLHKIVKNDTDLKITDEDISIVEISLNILNIILIGNPKLSEKEISLLDIIQHQLIYMSKNSVDSLKSCAQNLSILIKSYLIFPIMSDQNRNSQIEDSKRKYNKAIQYTFDQLVPVRAQGISLLKEMIEAKDPIVDVNEVLNLLIGLIKDNDSFVYLNAINCLTSLSNNHNNYIIEYLLTEYANDLKYNLDERIRIGDAIFKIIQNIGKMIHGKISDTISKTMLDISTSSTNDIRIRSSALNILAIACNCSFYGMDKWCFIALKSVLDILNFEKTQEHIILRRAAIVLIANILEGTDDLMSIPSNLLQSTLKTIRYIQVTDQDILMRRQALGLLDLMKQKLKEKLGFYSHDTILNIIQFS
ncbi:hypothetical protein T552_01472 [Pneumocystis carinii B80]|uniref:Uncharacterized protein n=1 Tax=Pneumocystis carinii (strain B80) TaxID=1408658 RepID=A0A0W4ZKG1_PNEC8|nr:hypothetical protein T552_01472 [Pneumocystis carinii B80]KTW28843.1 hypothetical protein T552_01472 [Pneumocystis carinii B80]